MPTAPYAKLRASLGGGAPASGVLVGAPGQTCQLSQDLAGGGTTFKYELRDYPEGWACPANWATDSGGVYYYVGATPPPFTLPALPLWGKILPVLTVNNGDPGTSGLPATQFVDRSTVLSTPDPSGNEFEDIAYGESNQWDARRKWMGALKRNIRRMAAGGVVGALGPYASATQRRAAVLTSADIRKEALQTDTNPPTLWKVLAVSGGVGVWSRIDSGAEVLVVSPLVTMVGQVKQMFEAATGLSASAWTDQSPSAANLGGGADWTTGSDAGGAYARVVGASFQYKTSALTLAAPATTPIMLDVIVQQDTFTASAPLFSLETGGKCFVLQTTSGNVKMRNGSDVGPTAFALGAFKRVRCIFTGATSGAADSIQIGAATPATGFAGNDLPNGLTLGAANGSFFTGKYRAAYLYTGTASTPQKAALDAYYESKWPGVCS